MAYSFKNWLNSAKGLDAADKQMSFQSIMSGTAHEREIADLKAAGLNPVLSAGGSGASSPVGAYDQELGAQSASAGYRIVKKAVSSSQKTADNALDLAREALKASNAERMSNLDIKPLSDSSNPKRTFTDINTPSYSNSAKNESSFDQKWKENMLSWNDFKEYVTSQNGTKWYDSPKPLSINSIPQSGDKSMSFKALGYLFKQAFYQNRTDFSKNVRSKAFKEALKHLSPKAKKQYYEWMNQFE